MRLRRAEAVRSAAAGILVSCLGACAGTQVAAKPKPRWAALRVIATPANARVYLVDRYLGMAAALDKAPARLKPGRAYVTVQAPGYLTEYLSYDLKPGLSELRVELFKLPRLAELYAEVKATDTAAASSAPDTTASPQAKAPKTEAGTE